MRTITQLGGRFSLDTDFLDKPSYGPPQWLQSLIGEDYFANIVSVNLGTAPIDDAVVRRLARLRHLQSLGIWRTGSGDQDLSRLLDLNELETLDISQTAVTDVGLERLRGMKSMRVLVVGGDLVSDAGLKALKQLSHLTLLCVVGNQFSPAARQELERSLPEATVVFVPLPQVASGSARPSTEAPPGRHPPPPAPAPAPAKAPRPGQFT
ncbi:MAG: hypothetical protein ACREHD_25595 [Pirellulales bacterium]